jgi:hypothetical protein
MAFARKQKIDLTPIWTEPPLKKVAGKRKDKYYTPKPKLDKTKFYLYKQKVWELTNINCAELIDIDTRGFKTFHIDHKISVHYGFKHNIPIEHIAHTSNLRMLHYKDNMLKGKKCFIDNLNEWIIEDNSIK